MDRPRQNWQCTMYLFEFLNHGIYFHFSQFFFKNPELPFPAPMNLAMLGPRAETPPPFLACNNKTLGYFWHDVHCTGNSSIGLFRISEKFSDLSFWTRLEVYFNFWDEPSLKVFVFCHVNYLNSNVKVEKILKGSVNLIPSPSPSSKIQIMGRKICLMCKGKLCRPYFEFSLKKMRLNTGYLLKWSFFIDTGKDGSGKNQKSWFFLLGLKYTSVTSVVEFCGRESTGSKF